MEDYKNISVNSEIDDAERVKRGLYNYLHDRVWGDAHLLGGFSEIEISGIIDDTIDKFGEDINHFVAVALEKVANEELNKNE
jgi:hypothetical protein